MGSNGSIRVGVGGWVYAPWRETFYPPGLPAARQLAFAASKLTAIEINATFYRTQTEATFRKWAAETPDGFVFTVKAHRYATSRTAPDAFGEAIDFFLRSGVLTLGEKLGAIDWQFAPFRRFEPGYFEAFLAALPPERAGVRLRHAIEVRHGSFLDPAFADLLRAHGCAMVYADDPDWPAPDWETADFAYARFQGSRAEEEAGYPPAELDAIARMVRGWARTRDVFAFFISGAKARDPAAAVALLDRLGASDRDAAQHRR